MFNDLVLYYVRNGQTGNGCNGQHIVCAAGYRKETCLTILCKLLRCYSGVLKKESGTFTCGFILQQRREINDLGLVKSNKLASHLVSTGTQRQCKAPCI